MTSLHFGIGTMKRPEVEKISKALADETRVRTAIYGPIPSAINPPSTQMISAVTKLALSDAR
jgi:hypothetical protein